MFIKSENESRDQRLRDMGEMAARIAHEIRNPLGSIELNTSLLKRELDGDKRKITERILASTRSLNAVVSNLLYYTKSPKPSIRSVRLSSVVDDLLYFIEFMLKQQSITVVKDYTIDGDILGDKELLKQVFLNILRNAVQAMPSGGLLTVSIKRAAAPGGRDPRSYNLIDFKDTGSGIDPGIIDKIFYPFFTSKDDGTGLGLAIAQNIIDSLDGRIEVTSHLGSGSTFEVYLPSSRSQTTVKE